MPNFVPIVLTDRAPTPVAHTFIPRGIDTGVATAVESTGVPLGERRLSFATNRTTSGRVKVSVKLAFPIVQDATVNGITKPTVVRTTYVDLSLNYDGASTLQERNDIVGMIYSLLATSQTSASKVLVDLEGLY